MSSETSAVEADHVVFGDYRLVVIRIALLISWVGLGIFAYVGSDLRGIEDPTILGPAAVLGGCLVALTLLPWKRYIQRTRLGDGFVLVWAILMVAGVMLVETLRMEEPSMGGFLVAAVFVAASLSAPVTVITAVVVAGAGYAVSLLSDSAGIGTIEVVTRVALFAVISLFVLLLAGGVRRQLDKASQRLVDATAREIEIADKEEELDRLYEVSRTIGAGSNLAEVLPELVGRVVAAVRCKVGLVLLYRSDDEALEVMSPIWVAGHTLRAEGYKLPLNTSGITQRVFTSTEPVVVNDVDVADKDALLTDLDVQRVAAVPLQIESRTIGVLMVADKTEGPFLQEDLQRLQSLAGPSALVLNQMSRYEEAKETGEKMAEIAQLKTDFVSVVSHELRTPLTSIIGALKTLTRPELAPSDPNARELVASAEKQANRLRALIEDLLVVSRLDNRALPVRPETMHIKTMLAELVSAIPEASRRVLVDVGADTSHLEADPDHLRRILTNLIENALKYATGSSIEVTARVSGSEVWISIVDHGTGIPYELHDHIFDRFTQIERPDTRAKGGTGLGLSIVRGLAEAMGGRVWFEPTIGGGATFTVALPKSAGPMRSQERASATS